MVKKKKLGDKKIYLCEICGLDMLTVKQPRNVKNGAGRRKHALLKSPKSHILSRSSQEK